MPLLPPIYLPGQEPLPAGTTDWERQEMQTALKYQRYMGMVMESCPLKVTIAGVGGESQWSLKECLLMYFVGQALPLVAFSLSCLLLSHTKTPCHEPLINSLQQGLRRCLFSKRWGGTCGLVVKGLPKLVWCTQAWNAALKE